MVTTTPTLRCVKEIEVRQGARVIKQISGSQLQAQRGFTADKWTDSQGRQGFRGDVRNGRDWVDARAGLGRI